MPSTDNQAREAMELVRSMRSIDALSPAIHDFEKAKREEAWSRVDEKVDAAIATLRSLKENTDAE